jgi:multiple sugar transport system ATP-binding protein
MATVTFDHVWKRYGDVVAVKDLNLDIQDEEFLVLVGPSGCGKTTALRMIAGLEEISEGTLKIGDRTVNDLAPKDRDVAMVFQSYALYPHMSVYDNLAFGLKLRKVPKAEIDKRVREAAGTIELSNLLDRKPKQLSGGQRQRVALGRAIVREPAVFLMDEPLSNLDAKLRVQTRAEIARLHQRLRTTVVYVTHDQVEAMTMGDRIAVMNFGVLQQVGPPQELYERPVNKFVAGFIGSPAMNFINMKPDRSNGRFMLKNESLELPVPDRLSQSLEKTDGEVTAGIRPEHFRVVDGDGGGQGNGATIRATTDVVEFLGNEELLHVRVGDHDLVAIVDASHRVRPGDVLDLWVPLDKIHVFDTAEGKSIN